MFPHDILDPGVLWADEKSAWKPRRAMLAHRVVVKLKEAGYEHNQAQAPEPEEALKFSPDLDATTRAPVGDAEVSDEMKKYAILSKQVSKHQKEGKHQIRACIPPLHPPPAAPYPPTCSQTPCPSVWSVSLPCSLNPCPCLPPVTAVLVFPFCDLMDPDPIEGAGPYDFLEWHHNYVTPNTAGNKLSKMVRVPHVTNSLFVPSGALTHIPSLCCLSLFLSVREGHGLSEPVFHTREKQVPDNCATRQTQGPE